MSVNSFTARGKQVDMELREYAPVVIPTLNRFEHFKRCLESLERCTGAEFTDVYVGLDYPPSDRYVEGWKLIDTYLKEKEACNVFRNLFVRRRESNCGVGKAGSNGNLLTREVREVTDRFIYTEDDNEFSICFLEYMNNALEKYKDDERVVCVCGYTPIDIEGNENIYFAHQMFAWGTGRWVNKNKEISKLRNLESMEKALRNFSDSMRLFKYRPIILSRVMDQVIHKKLYGDISHTFYCVLYDKYCIYPSKTLVRNWGYDGTGVHCKNVDESFTYREICNDPTFEPDNVEIAERKEIRKRITKVASKKWYGHFAILLRYLIWRVTSFDIFFLRKSK